MTDLIPIVTDEKLLRVPCKPVSVEEGERIGTILVEQLKARRDTAVGLAANQIGIDARVFAIRNGEEYIFFINPEITHKSEPRLFKDEGCLSLPGRKINTVRFESVSSYDLKNGGMNLENFAAVVFQHELEHLNGKLMVDTEMKLYDPCPCESGRKFKFCHYR